MFIFIEHIIAPESVANSKAEDYKRQCINVNYENVVQNPDKYVGRDITFICTVLVAEEAGSLAAYTLGQDKPGEVFGSPWNGVYKIKQGEKRLIEGDYIRVYGKFKGFAFVFPQIEIRYYKKLN